MRVIFEIDHYGMRNDAFRALVVGQPCVDVDGRSGRIERRGDDLFVVDGNRADRLDPGLLALLGIDVDEAKLQAAQSLGVAQVGTALNASAFAAESQIELHQRLARQWPPDVRRVVAKHVPTFRLPEDDEADRIEARTAELRLIGQHVSRGAPMPEPSNVPPGQEARAAQLRAIGAAARGGQRGDIVVPPGQEARAAQLREIARLATAR